MAGSILFGIFVFLGLFCIAQDIAGVPALEAERHIKSLSDDGNRKTSGLEVLFGKLSFRLSKIIKLSSYRRAKLETDLLCSGINETPEKFICDALVSGLVFLVPAVIFLFIFPLLSIPFVLIGTVLTVSALGRPSKLMKEKRKEIESELPMLAEYIKKNSKTGMDVTDILTSFVPMAGDGLSKELETTVADMKTGSRATALLRLENRVGLPALGDIVRGLNSMEQGDDTVAFWETECLKLRSEERQRLKTKALEVPGRIRKLSFALMCCFILMYIVVFAQVLMSSLTGIL